MAISREAVIWGYRLFLGRDPESEDTIELHMHLEDHAALTRALTGSDEFKNNVRMENLFGEMRTIRLSELPRGCLGSEQIRSIGGSITFPARDEQRLSCMQLFFHGGADQEMLTGIEIVLRSIPDELSIHLSNSYQKVTFGTGCSGKWSIQMWETSTVIIGNDVTSNGTEAFINGGGTLIIGDDCMFATAFIHVGDNHAIFDVETGKVLNYLSERKIEIGKHVWLASRVTILADTKIGAGSIVGVGSVVKGEFEPASLIAGIPAKTKKTGVSWTRSYQGTGAEDVIDMLRSV